MDVYLTDEYQDSDKVLELIKKIKMVTLGNVISSCHILCDPLPLATPVSAQQQGGKYFRSA